jgi:hypothetical protein
MIAVLLALALFGPGVRGVHAAGNVIPDPTDQLLSAPDLSPEAEALKAQVIEENERFGRMVPNKGALGRIDRTYLTPLRPAPIRVAVDGRFDLGTTADLVGAMIVTGGPDAQRSVAVTGSPTLCDTVAQKDPTGQRPTPTCSPNGITRVEGQPQLLDVTLPLPTQIIGLPAARIVVFRAPSADVAARTLQRMATTECAAVRSNVELAATVGVCIDTIHTPTGAPDLVKCRIMLIPNPLPWNDFAEQCQNGSGSQDLPACENDPFTLASWEDDCHGVYVPFDWTRIRGTPPHVFDRQVRGRTALSREREYDGGRIWVPGPEFVGTLLEDDWSRPDEPLGSAPRAGAIDVWSPTPQEFGLTGVTDKPKSIVHVVPRLAVSRVCETPTEACLAVPTHPDPDVTRCACRDRHPADCTCSTLREARFFQCASSKMPCTRHAHCDPNELCNGKPRCQVAGEVWRETPPPAAGTTACSTDADCAPSTPQCGYLLFDVHQKREQGRNAVILDTRLQPGGPRKRRGVCTTNAGSAATACSNASGPGAPPPCPPTQGSCTEYTFEALGGTPAK